MSQNMQDLLQQARADALAAAPPMRSDVDQVVKAGRSRAVRGRLLRAGAGAGTAVAVAAALALPHAFGGAPAQTPAAGAAPATAAALSYPQGTFAYGFRGYTAGVFTVSAPILVTPGYQEAYVRRGDEMETMYDGSAPGSVASSVPGYSALLTVYRPGAFQATRFSGAQAVSVNGRPGLYSPSVHYQPGDTSPSTGALAWQYADNAWATVASVTPDGYSKAEFVQIAAGLTAAPATTPKTPVKLTWTPPGYGLTSVGATDDYPNGGPYMVSSQRLIKTRPAYTGLTATVDASAAGSPTFRVGVFPVAYANSSKAHPGTASYCNSGNADLCYRMTPDGKYQIELHSSGGLSQADLRHVLDSAQVADPANPQSWFPISA
ncbi:hypothetical protein [Dactylosporangium sp. CA-139066]|uniref:hypothetical protein n=1 Tax=Dactylosporangium sp. CA-139066 TaxID=3239930 RepID=UPI003D934E4F